MSDIEKRLRDLARIDNCQASLEAAAEIERLRAALRKIASNNQQRSNCFCGACIQARAARAALEGEP